MLTRPDPIDVCGGILKSSLVEARTRMTRDLLIDAIGRFEAALELMTWIDAAYGQIVRRCDDNDPAEAAERIRWFTLKETIGLAFDAADVALADQVMASYDVLSPEDQKIADGPFVERSVKFRGSTFTVMTDPAEHDSSYNLIGLSRDTTTLDLADEIGAETVNGRLLSLMA